MASLNKNSIVAVTLTIGFSDTITLVRSDNETLEFVSLTANRPIPNLTISSSKSNGNLVISISGKHEMIDVFQNNQIRHIPRESAVQYDLGALNDSPGPENIRKFFREDSILNPEIIEVSNSFSDIDKEERRVFDLLPQMSDTITYTLNYTNNSSSASATFTQLVRIHFPSISSTLGDYI
jgi:hypothetical protein